MIREIRFFDFCRIELLNISPVSQHTLEEVDLNNPKNSPFGMLHLTDFVRKVTYVARHQNKNINCFNFDFLFSIYLDSGFNIISVEVDTAKMINDYEKSRKDVSSQRGSTSEESILSVMTRFLLRAHLSLSVVFSELEKNLKESNIPLSLKIEKDYVDPSYITGRIVSPIKLFFSVIEFLIDDHNKLKDFVSSLNYENINDIFAFIEHTQDDDFDENVSYEENDISSMLNDAYKKVNEIGFDRLIKNLTSASISAFPEHKIKVSSDRDIAVFKKCQ